MSQASTQIAKQYMEGALNKKNWGTAMYNVLVEGLIGDGATNDTAALQALINTAIAAGRKAIFFPHGSYYVTALTNANQVVFMGDNASFVGGYVGTINQLGEGGITQAEFDALEASITSLQAETVTGIFNVKTGYGAAGNGVADDTAEIQAAINAAQTAGGGIVFFPKGTYNVSAPLEMTDKVKLVGAGISVSIIQKTTNTTGTYSIDSIVTLVHGGDYSYYNGIEGITLFGKSAAPRTAFGVYGLKTTQCTFRELYIKDVDTGFYTNDSWLTVMESISVQNCVRGYQFIPAVPSPSTVSGTSLTMTRCWVSNASAIGYDIQNLQYSTFNSCAVDNCGSDAVPAIAYNFKYAQGMTMNSCGAEVITGEVLKVEQSKMVVNGMTTANIDGVTAGTHGLIYVIGDSVLSMNGCTFPNFGTPRNSYRMYLDPAGFIKVVMINTRLAGNGLAYSIPATSTSVTALGVDNDDVAGMVLTENDRGVRNSFGAYQNSAQALLAGTFANVLFDTEEFDIKSEYDPTTGTWTVQRDGLYMLTISLAFGSMAAANRIIGIITAGGTEYKRFADYTAGSSGVYRAFGTLTLRLSAGSQIRVQAWSTTALSLQAGAANTYVTMAKIG